MPASRKQKKEVNEAVDALFGKVQTNIEKNVAPAYMKGNLNIQTYEGIRPSFSIAQTSAIQWFDQYRSELEDGGGTIYNRNTGEYEFVPWLSDWKTKTRVELTDALDSAIDEGWSIDETSDEIQDILNTESAHGDVIARTEIARAMFNGRMARIRQGGYTLVRWRTAPDREDVKACEECQALDNMVFPVDAFPEQPLHPNCRCICQPVISSLRFPNERAVLRFKIEKVKKLLEHKVNHGVDGENCSCHGRHGNLR